MPEETTGGYGGGPGPAFPGGQSELAHRYGASGRLRPLQQREVAGLIERTTGERVSYTHLPVISKLIDQTSQVTEPREAPLNAQIQQAIQVAATTVAAGQATPAQAAATLQASASRLA